MDLASYSLSLDPQQRQKMLAEVMRARQQGDGQEALAGAFKKSRGMDNMAVVAAMSRNPELATAAKLAQQNQQGLAPKQLGNQGFVLPESGQFVDSPMYTEEKAAARDATRENTQARIDAQRSAASERSALAASLAAQRDETQRYAIDQRATLAQALAAMRAGERGSRDVDKQEVKVGRDRDTAVTKYSAMLEKAAIPEFDSALEIAEARLKTHKEGTLPGYGRFAGAVPNAFASDDAQLARTDMMQAANILLKARSGAAVTESEMRRFLTEVASGAWMSEKALRNGWKNVRRSFDAKRIGVAAGAAPDVHDEFVARGGKDYRYASTADVPPEIRTASKVHVPSAAAPSAPKKRVRVDLEGNVLP